MRYLFWTRLFPLAIYGGFIVVCLIFLPRDIAIVSSIAFGILATLHVVFAPWKALPPYPQPAHFITDLAKLITGAQKEIKIVEQQCYMDGFYGDKRILRAFSLAVEKKVSITMIHEEYPSPDEYSEEAVRRHSSKKESFDIYSQEQFTYYRRIPVVKPHFVIVDGHSAMIERRHRRVKVKNRLAFQRVNRGWVYKGDARLVWGLNSIFDELKHTAQKYSLGPGGFGAATYSDPGASA